MSNVLKASVLLTWILSPPMMADSTLLPERLQVERLIDPIGLDVTTPRLSWRLDSKSPERRGQKQTAYQILVAGDLGNLQAHVGNLWDSGRVESSATLDIPYGGRALESRMQCFWKVRVWDQDNEPSLWSPPAKWSMGLLAESDWKAKWIASPETSPEAGPPNNGYHSALAWDSSSEKWIQIDLGGVLEFDSVELFPAKPFEWPDQIDYLFPPRFRIESSVNSDFSNPVLLVDQTNEIVSKEPGKPARYSFSPLRGRHLRLTVTEMARNPNGLGFALSDMQVHSNGRTVSAGARVTARDTLGMAGWDPENLTDGVIEGQAGSLGTEAQFPVLMLRKEFELDHIPTRATVYVTALGVYELRMNGEKVGKQYLAPEWTHYDRRVLYQTYDITRLIREGRNAIGAVVGDGWYRLRHGWGGHPPGYSISFDPPRSLLKDIPGRFYGDSVRRLLFQLELEQGDGTRKIIGTNESWEGFTDGPIRKATIYDGVTYDSRKETPGWDEPYFQGEGWLPAKIFAPGWPLQVEAQKHEPIRVISTFAPVTITEPKQGTYVFDFGQNFSGRCRLRVKGNPGQVIRLRHSEALDPQRMIYTANLWGAESTDTYVVRGTGQEEVFEPPFTYHGFRYVEVTGLGSVPDSSTLAATSLSSDLKRIGRIETSDPTLNRLWEAVHWTFRSNLMSVPSDVIGRDERLGWMGDTLAAWQSLCFMFDIASLGEKWLLDIQDSQLPNGYFTVYSPYEPGLSERPEDGVSPGWSDAGVQMPWVTHLNFQVLPLIEQAYEPARRFIEAVLERNPEYRWENARGFDYADWLDAQWISHGYNWTLDPSIPTIPKDLLATAYWFESTRVLSQMAAMLGRSEEADRYTKLAGGIRKAFNETFVRPDGTIQGDTQSSYAFSLSLDLLDDQMTEVAVRKLREKVEENDGHLSTGIKASKRLLLALSKHGYQDLAYSIAMHPEMPSWRYMLDNGATTIWERFDGYKVHRGFNDSKMNGFNHMGLTSVAEWIFRGIGGISPNEEMPGYQQINIVLSPPEQLNWTRTEYDSPRGRIISNWARRDEKEELTLVIPVNTTAVIRIPELGPDRISEEGHQASDIPGVLDLKSDKAGTTFRLTSGIYRLLLER